MAYLMQYEGSVIISEAMNIHYDSNLVMRNKIILLRENKKFISVKDYKNIQDICYV